MSKIQNIHDRTFRRIFSHKIIAIDFLQTYLPKHILTIVNLEHIEFCPNNYIDPKLKESLSDIVYRAPMLEDSTNYIYFLIEHQSKPDILMPIRALKYQLAIIENHLAQNPSKLNYTKLPIVFTFVVYNGRQKPYPYNLNILDLFHNKTLAVQTFAQPANLIDITQLSDEKINRHGIIGLFEMAAKHIHDRDLSPIVKNIIALIIKISKIITQPRTLSIYIRAILYYITNIGKLKKPREIISKLQNIPLIGEKFMGTIANYLKKQGITEGEAKAKAQIAKSMLESGSDIQFIIKITNLTKEQIVNLT
jgi:predicted transposase/invertase (TIGR01784 family)